MTFRSVHKGLPAKLCLLLLVPALFARAALSATTHPRYVALASALQRGHGGGGSGASAAVLVAIIGVIGTILAAFISSRRGKS